MKRKAPVTPLITVFFILVLTSCLGILFERFGFPETNIVIIYLLSVVIISRITSGYTYGISASIISTLLFNYLFTKPYYTLAVDNSSYILTFITMTATAIITSTLTSSIQQNTLRAQEKERETQTLYRLTSRLTNTIELSKVAVVLEEAIQEAFHMDAYCLYFDEHRNLLGTKVMSKDFENQRFQATNESIDDFYQVKDAHTFWTIKGREEILGQVIIESDEVDRLSELQKRTIISMIENTALAMERILFAYQKEESNKETKLERQRSHLLRGISHDLRTPLSGMRATSEMLINATPIDDSRYKMIKTIQEDILWLHSLVENVLSLTRLQNGRLSLTFEQQALEEILEEAIRITTKRFPETTIQVSMPEKLIVVVVDVKLILQVFINLLENAIKHATDQLVIEIDVKLINEDFVQITIADNGKGIPTAELETIFKPFHTIGDKPIDSKNRIGLGLTICETAIVIHGGTIAAHNRKQQTGAAFIFTLPLKEISNELSE
ncbi:DUF4118 domain-containing protein [Marinilactibacillus kalidii]|uniref:DUF4118 domain-containing protein n=1 Tax=Marinilactibacillus kalidii TaxID=2820274 RepID=UPI001ABED368|nr:DUF4118 domain-containing protein [Marinilactibacillus kalidii]